MTTFALTKALDKLQKVQEEKLQGISNKQQATSDKRQATSALPMPHVSLRVGEVFSINFLRGEVVPMRVRRTLAYAALGYLVVHLALLFILFKVASASRTEWQSLEATLGNSSASLGTLRQEMDTMVEQATRDIAQFNTFIALEKDQFPVGGKLAALAKTLPARTWVTGVSGDREGHKITVQASYLINPESPYELPMKKWVEALKGNDHFGKHLKRLNVESSSQKMQGKVELCNFELVAEWDK
ncbi:MAG: hypothetical protein HY590_04475 [Candidatus Omnitrophica bacterium]|nr:hypothetical protein [Candidatus Omnitrophota bacterium]